MRLELASNGSWRDYCKAASSTAVITTALTRRHKNCCYRWNMDIFLVKHQSSAFHSKSEMI